MNIFIASFVAGFTMAALPGAVQSSILQSALAGKARGAVLFALGAAVMDGLYMVFVYFGLIQFIFQARVIFYIVTVIGVVYLLCLGVGGLRAVFREATGVGSGERKGFTSGLMLVLCHPPTIMYFLGLAPTIFSGPNLGIIQTISLAGVLFAGAAICFALVFLIGHMIARTKCFLIIKAFRVLASCLILYFAFDIFWRFILFR